MTAGRFTQSGRLDPGIRPSDGIGVWASLIDGRLDMRKQSADLSGNCRAFYGRPHGTAIGVSNHQDYFRAQDRRAILEAGDNLRGDDIAGHAGNKNTSDRQSKTSSTGTRESAHESTAAKGSCFSTVFCFRMVRSYSWAVEVPSTKRLLPAINSCNAASALSAFCGRAGFGGGEIDPSVCHKVCDCFHDGRLRIRSRPSIGKILN